jgi:hypothetical protein
MGAAGFSSISKNMPKYSCEKETALTSAVKCLVQGVVCRDKLLCGERVIGRGTARDLRPFGDAVVPQHVNPLICRRLFREAEKT